MSIKRQATTDLNHENWDQDDPSEHEEMGTFKSASKDVLEKRVIRTAKRRTQASGDQANKSVFSGFGGFNKAQPSSFDFLANLTNGSKSTNGSTTNKDDTPASSGLFSSKPSSGLFSIPEPSSGTTSKPFGIPTSQTSGLGGGIMGASKPTTISTPFNVSKSESSSTGSLFKVQTSPVSSDANGKDTKLENTSTAFGTSVFSMKKDNTSPFKMSNTTPKLGSTGFNTEKKLDDKNEDKNEDNKLKYYAKLKGLNVSVSDWIRKHVEETPLCILTPIFKDYEKYLKEIQDEFEGVEDQSKKPNETIMLETKSNNTNTAKNTNESGSSPFTNSNKKSDIFGGQSLGEKPSGFAFGINTSSGISKTTSSGSFSFGMANSTPQTSTAMSSSAFSLETKSAAPAASAPFSFGTGKPFSFSPNTVQKPAEATTEANDEQDEPPKVEFTPIVEENSVFDKRCKIFVKKDGNFVDKGVATLYIKKIEESGKHQLLVRANTNLGNILLNLILSSGIPTQRLGKNNVMLVCIPTPDAKPPPTSVLIRVKTSEEADDLLETLNKYKA